MNSSKKRTGLGRGLEALLQPGEKAEYGNPEGVGTVVQQLEPTLLDRNSYQPRSYFSEEELEELTASVKEHGILQPIVVRPKNGRYEIVAGERRWRAAMRLQLTTVPAIVREMSDNEAAELALIENLQRTDLSPLELAKGMDSLQKKFRYTQEQLAQKLGKSRPAVANTLRLLTLPQPIQEAVDSRQLTDGHGKVLAGIKDPALQQRLFREAVEKGMTVRQLEQAAAAQREALSREGNKKPGKKPLLPEITAWEQSLRGYLGARVKVKGDLNGGTITITYSDRDTLEGLFEKLKEKEF